MSSQESSLSMHLLTNQAYRATVHSKGFHSSNEIKLSRDKEKIEFERGIACSQSFDSRNQNI